MARAFDGTDDVIWVPVPSGAATAYSFHGFLNTPSVASSKMATAWEETNIGNAEHEKYLTVVAGGTSHWTAFDGASRQTTPSAGAMSVDTWYGQGYTQSATTLTHYFNGAAVGSVAAAGIYSLYASAIMVFGHGTATGYYACRWAECALWSEILTADEMAALGKGISPLLVRPKALIRYLPLYGRVSPEPDLKGLGVGTLIGGPTQYDHPKIIMPRDAIQLP